jgi:hypothetical protein
MTDTTRQIIDFAQDDNGVEFRNALYSAIHDKVTDHIEAKKQEIAHSLIAPQQEMDQEDSQTEVEQQETEVENT